MSVPNAHQHSQRASLLFPTDRLSGDIQGTLQRQPTLLDKKIDRLHSLLVRESNKENDPTKHQSSDPSTKSTLEKIDSITAIVLDLRATNDHYRRVMGQELTVCVQELKSTVAQMKGYFDEWDKLASDVN